MISAFCAPGPKDGVHLQEVHRDFETALAVTPLPERPGYEKANQFLLKARRHMAAFGTST